MTDAIIMADGFTSLEAKRAAKSKPLRRPTVLTLSLMVFTAAWLWETVPVAVPPNSVRSIPAPTMAATAYDRLLDPAFSLGVAPPRLGDSVPLGSAFEAAAPTPNSPVPIEEAEADIPLPSPTPSPEVAQLVASVPLPTPRPPDLRGSSVPGSVRAGARLPVQSSRTSVAAAAPDKRTFFEKIFGGFQAPAGPVLAYASPEDNASGNRRSITSGPMLPHDQGTAVYDIAAHTVYMPDGSKLEAHSGLGDRLDDPRHVSERMRGATPPHVYELEPRKQLFHGVQALRLNPVGAGSVFGRSGLLAHTFMLGPNGDSNGCVSFRNYSAFLQAYITGQVKRLVVVARQS